MSEARTKAPAVARQPSRPGAFILDLYGGYVRQLGGWLAVAHLVRLVADLGVDDQAARSALSRMTRSGFFERQRVGGMAGYSLTERARTVLEEADHRILAAREPARLDEGWVLVSFSIPEARREKRHMLRSRLAWLGFGTVSAGLWIAPARLAPELRTTVDRLELAQYVDVFTARYEGFVEVRELVSRCWDLDELRRIYSDFIDTFTKVQRRWSRRRASADPQAAFVDFTEAIHSWQRFPALDPGLPPEVLPARWEGRVAGELFSDLQQRLAEAAIEHVRGVVRST